MLLSFPPVSIGPLRIDPPVFSAPMAGFTNYAYREMLRSFGGVGLIATEMVSARSFVELEKRGEEHPDRLWGVRDEPRPLAVQIWDNDPGTLAELGGRLAHDYRVSLVDLNFGCPARQIAGKSASGSFLLKTPEKIAEIVCRVAAACQPVPVSAKIRLGLTRDTINATEVAVAVEEAGAAALFVHGRTAQDMYSGTADWDAIARIKPYLRRIPLVGNGDIKTADDAIARLRDYPIDGVMIGRGGLSRPWIFRQIWQKLNGKEPEPDPTLAEQREILLKHYELVRKRFGDSLAVILMRKYACDYALGKPGARRFRSLISQVKNQEQFLQTVQEEFPSDDDFPQEDCKVAFFLGTQASSLPVSS
ncbi:MAG: tRNA-dihydrouridine synthase [Planctomycetaceae bacterium]|nr:tRNA-dihydrouridine synthase [Planctomycetaceae bacterium]